MDYLTHILYILIWLLEQNGK